MERCLNLKFVFGTAVVFKRTHFNCVQNTAQQFTDPSATLHRVRVGAIRRVVAGGAAVRDEAFNPLPRAHVDQVERDCPLHARYCYRRTEHIFSFVPSIG